MIQQYVNWSGQSIKLTWLPQQILQESSKVTSVHGICFHHGRVLLVYVKNRGFNYPGGHVEFGETPEEALHREALEEGYVKGYVKGSIQYIGAIEVSHEENPFFIEGGKYPMIGYQLFYKMTIEECLPFWGEHETIDRIWVEPEGVPDLINDHKLAHVILQEALTI